MMLYENPSGRRYSYSVMEQMPRGLYQPNRDVLSAMRIRRKQDHNRQPRQLQRRTMLYQYPGRETLCQQTLYRCTMFSTNT